MEIGGNKGKHGNTLKQKNPQESDPFPRGGRETGDQNQIFLIDFALGDDGVDDERKLVKNTSREKQTRGM